MYVCCGNRCLGCVSGAKLRLFAPCRAGRVLCARCASSGMVGGLGLVGGVGATVLGPGMLGVRKLTFTGDDVFCSARSKPLCVCRVPAVSVRRCGSKYF